MLRSDQSSAPVLVGADGAALLSVAPFSSQGGSVDVSFEEGELLGSVRVRADASRGGNVGLRLTAIGEGVRLLDPDCRVIVAGGVGVPGREAGSLSALMHEGVARGGSFYILLHSEALGTSLLVGIGAPPDDFPYFSTDSKALDFGFEIDCGQCGEREYSVLLGVSSCPHALLEAYGDRLARFARPITPRPVGYNSWDYYSGCVSMADLRSEMAALAQAPYAGRVQYVCIDMGWENMWGDWRPNRKFPETYREIADEIRAAGFLPGIWVSPLQANVYLPIARHRRDLFCRDETGEPVIRSANGECLLWDPTVPDVRAMFHETFSAMRQAGFELFKIDYIYRQYVDAAKRFFDESLGKAAVIRLLLQTIRGAIGDEAHLISCGAPTEAALGVADSARVSGDIHNFWGHVKACTAQAASCYWMHNRLWVNDPDFAIIRSAQTTDDPYLNRPYTKRELVDEANYWLAGPEASYDELRTWLTVVYLTGGSVFLSDSLPRLNELGRATLDRLLSAPPVTARPLDLLSDGPPSVWVGQSEGRRVVGVINWSDQERTVALPEAADLPEGGRDLWTGDKVTTAQGVRLAARSAVVVQSGA